MNELHEQFVSESRELIQQATDDMLAVERSGFDASRIDRIFRAFHTLKGSAAVVELPAMTLILHAAEDLLAAVDSKQRPITTELVNETLLCLDTVSKWIDAFDSEAILPSDAGEAARSAAERLRGLISDDPAAPTAGQTAPTEAPPWVIKLRRKISATADPGSRPLVAVAYTPLAGCFFNGVDPLRLIEAIPNLVAMEIESREPWPPLADLDPFACNIRISAIAAATRGELAHIFRLVPDQIQMFELPADAQSELASSENAAPDLLRDIVTHQIHLIEAASSSASFAGRAGSAAKTVINALRHDGRERLVAEVEAAAAATLAQRKSEPLAAALRSVSAQLVEAAIELPRESGAIAHAAGNSLRIDEARINALFSLSGEMIVAKNTSAHLSHRIEQVVTDPDLAREVRSVQESLERLTTEMHGAILQLRMVPVSQLFRSFPRVVRDIALRLGERVDLITQGETTECDKIIVERLFEPLLHLVRNALDHGIEAPEQRRSAGKPELAKLTLRASRSGDRLAIEVADDGRGIDPEAVKQTARERGLIPSQDIDALSDDQAVHLIFTAGFSTASAVSEISGRGVGMDVVRNAVEQIGGRITLTSEVGTGTMIRLDLPISVAMSQIMIVDAGGQSFGVPMDAVTETLRLTPDRISQFKDNRGFVLRDRIVPICSLAELLDLPITTAHADAPRLLIVAQAAGRIAALEVDAIRDRLDAVLKPLQGVLSNARGYSGTTMTADGRVLLVLDLKEIVP
jgi:two-component system, chemotaxis family, sensor kinase CheA